MICCGVPRTLPSGPALSKTRLMMLPMLLRGRLLLLLLLWLPLLPGLFLERDLFDGLMPLSFPPLVALGVAMRLPLRRPSVVPDVSVHVSDPPGVTAIY